MLQLAHYNILSRHPGRKRIYAGLRRYFCWPYIAPDCYKTVKFCIKCAIAPAAGRKRKNIRLFPAFAPLEFVSFGILGELIRNPEDRYLLVVADRISELIRAVPLKWINAATVGKSFNLHWEFVYRSPLQLISDNAAQFNARFFRTFTALLYIENIFTTTYQP